MPYSRAPSAKILANRKAKVVMNRAALDAAVLGMADALLAVGLNVLDDAASGAPTDPAMTHGIHLKETGVLGVWAAGKKTGGNMVGKPRVTTIVESTTIPGTYRSLRRVAATPKDQAVLFVGFSAWWAHFAELGTIKEVARPFLTPALNRNLGTLGGNVVPAMAKRIRSGL